MSDEARPNVRYDFERGRRVGRVLFREPGTDRISGVSLTVTDYEPFPPPYVDLTIETLAPPTVDDRPQLRIGPAGPKNRLVGGRVVEEHTVRLYRAGDRDGVPFYAADPVATEGPLATSGVPGEVRVVDGVAYRLEPEWRKDPT